MAKQKFCVREKSFYKSGATKSNFRHPWLCRCATPHVQRTTPISYANVVYYINLCFCYHSGSKLAPETHALQTRYIFPIACENKITARDTSFVGCRKRREAAKRVQVAKHVSPLMAFVAIGYCSRNSSQSRDQRSN